MPDNRCERYMTRTALTNVGRPVATITYRCPNEVWATALIEPANECAFESNLCSRHYGEELTSSEAHQEEWTFIRIGAEVY